MGRTCSQWMGFVAAMSPHLPATNTRCYVHFPLFGFPHLENREAFLGSDELLAAPASPLVPGVEGFLCCEALQSRIEGSHAPGQLHGEIEEGIEGIAAVPAVQALKLLSDGVDHVHGRASQG